MTADLTNPIFHDEDAARTHMEAVRWPNGPFCPHCGAVECITRLQGKSHRAGLHQCNSCEGHFTVTNGTVMERSHISLAKWVLAFHLMASSKKGVSAHQIHRNLGITYKSAWFMCHRIREAMSDPSPAPVGGDGKIVEADEMYHGKRERPAEISRQAKHQRRANAKSKQQREILALGERGGEARVQHVNHITGKNLREFVATNADSKSRLHTDESALYLKVGNEFATHETVHHAAKEYARGDVTTNSVEGFFGIFKRGMVGVYQHCGEAHLQRYLNEFTFRYNHRIALGVDDAERAVEAIKGAEGKRLTYRGL